jgi:hypothetical protein
MRHIRAYWLLALLVSFPLVLSGCADDSDYWHIRAGLVGVVDEPGTLVGAPQLTLEYRDPFLPGVRSARIYSDQPLGGDIAFDPVRNAFTITHGPAVVLFGIDAADAHHPEFRAFLDFPLDGAAGGPVIPLDADILFATLKMSVDFVDFAGQVPVRMDLVSYSVRRGLEPADFDSPPLAVRYFDILDFDAGKEVLVDVTHMMREAQRLGLNDFQVRLMLD